MDIRIRYFSTFWPPVARWNEDACLSAGGLTFGVFVTQRRLPHVAESQGAFAAAVHKKVTVVGVKLCRGDHLGQILHVGWLNVHDVWGKESLRETTVVLELAESTFMPQMHLAWIPGETHSGSQFYVNLSNTT